MKKLLLAAIFLFPAALYADSYQKVDVQTVMVTKTMLVPDLQAQLKNIQAQQDREQMQHDLKIATYEAKKMDLKTAICTADNTLSICK